MNCNFQLFIWSGILVESPEEATLKICCLECQGISSVSGWMREIQEVTPSPVHTIYCGMTPRNFSWSLCTNSKEVLVLKGMCHVCCNCGVSCIEIRNQSGHQNLSHFDSGLVISRTFLCHAGSCCTLLFCLYLVFYTQKMHWRQHSLADTVPLFSNILQFSSELSNNWGSGLPVYALNEFTVLVNSHKASLFLCLFSYLSFLCLHLLHHGSYL